MKKSRILVAVAFVLAIGAAVAPNASAFGKKAVAGFLPDGSGTCPIQVSCAGITGFCAFADAACNGSVLGPQQ